MKKILLSFLSALFVFVTTFILLEIILRVYGNYSVNAFKYQDIGDKYLVMFRPNYTYTHIVEQINEVSLNEIGMHDLPITTSNRQLNNSIIGIFGDSFVAGVEVPLDSTFTAILNRKSSNKKFANFGVCGTGTAYQYVLYNSIIKPQIKIETLMLCVFLGNDIDNNNPFKKRYRRFEWVVEKKGNVKQMNGDYPLSRKVIDLFRSKSVAVNEVHGLLYRLKSEYRSFKNKIKLSSQENMVSKYDDIEYLSLEDSLTVNYTVNLIDKWNRELIRDNVEFIIVIFKNEYQSLPLNQKFFANSLLNWGNMQNRQIIDISFKHPNDKHFEYIKNGELKLGHMNERGHDSVASILHTRLLKERIINNN